MRVKCLSCLEPGPIGPESSAGDNRKVIASPTHGYIVMSLNIMVKIAANAEKNLRHGK